MKRMLSWLAVGLCLAASPVAAVAQDKLPIRIGFQSGDINVILMYAVNTGLFEKNGLEVIIAGAGGAAHLPGMTASLTALPVIGVPVSSKQLKGLDSLLSIVQMPAGIPVATVSIGNARNAGLLAARILGVKYPAIRKAMKAFMVKQERDVLAQRLEV